MADEKTSQVTVEDIIDGAIVEGFKAVGEMYVGSLEESLRRNILVSEAGSAQSMLQEMIDATQEDQLQQESSMQLSELEEKLAKVIR